MRTAGVIVALLMAGASLEARQGAHTPADAQGVSSDAALAAWHLDLGATFLGEAWDRNGSSEWLGGVVAGADRRLWRSVALRAEIVALRVAQSPDAAWLRGFTVGPRVRWRAARVRPVIDVAVGLSDATRPTPPGGTRFNYLAVIGAGVEAPAASMVFSVTGRWFHASNNGRDGRHRNPDIQALGVVLGIGWNR